MRFISMLSTEQTFHKELHLAQTYLSSRGRGSPPRLKIHKLYQTTNKTYSTETEMSP
jgi:hypothetical protein